MYLVRTNSVNTKFVGYNLKVKDCHFCTYLLINTILYT